MADTVGKPLTASEKFRAEMQAERAEFRARMAAHRSDMQAEKAEFRSDMAKLRSVMQAQSAELRSEMAAHRSDMQSDLQALELRLTIRLGAVVGATSLVTIGVLAALIALL